MIKRCPQCGNEPHTQDDLHGKGNRVFNETNHNGFTQRKCTVCGYSESVGSEKKK